MSAGSLPKCIGFILLSFRQVAWKSAGECMRNANKSLSPRLHNGERNRKLIRNPYPGLDHHLQLITSRESPLAHVYHVWSTSVTTMLHLMRFYCRCQIADCQDAHFLPKTAAFRPKMRKIWKQQNTFLSENETDRNQSKSSLLTSGAETENEIWSVSSVSRLNILLWSAE